MSEPVSTKKYARGTVVFSQGDLGDVAYIVSSGKVVILSESRDFPTRIAVRGPGAIIGEMALATDARRSATVVAETDCVLMVIDKFQIESRMAEADPILKLILLTAFERLREQAERADYFRSEQAQRGMIETKASTIAAEKSPI